jgi:hypothetical protein
VKRKPEIIKVSKYEPHIDLEDDFLFNDISRPFIHSQKGPVMLTPAHYVFIYDNGAKRAFTKDGVLGQPDLELRKALMDYCNANK